MKENEREEKSLAPGRRCCGKAEAPPAGGQKPVFPAACGRISGVPCLAAISGAIGDKDWQTTKLVGVIAGVVFAAVGIWLLIRNLRAEAKKYEAAQQPEDPEDKEGEDET